MLYVIIPYVIFLLLLYFIVQDFRKNERLLKFSENLFNNELIPLCENVFTLDECNSAFNILYNSCVDDNSNIYKIHPAYYKKFQSLQSFLHGKIRILENIKSQQ